MLLPAAALAVLCAAAPAAGALPAASSNEHLWVVVETDDGHELRHHAAAMDGPWFSRGLRLAGPPEAMAGWGDRLWLVFGADGAPPLREVYSVEVRPNPAFDAWYFSPHDRLRAMPGLDGGGELQGLAGTAGGPVAFLRFPDGSKLLRLRGNAWSELALPEGFLPGRACRLGTGGDLLLLVSEAPRAGGPATVWRRDPGGAWSSTALEIDVSRLRGLIRVGPATAAVLEPRPGRVEIAYLRPEQLLPLAQLEARSRWAAAGLRDGPRLIEQSPEGTLTIRRIDPTDGDATDRETMMPQPLMTSRVLHRPILFAVAITALLLVLLLKPGPRDAIEPPADLRVLAPLPRLIALAVDFAAAGLLVVAVLRVPPAELARMPMWTTDVTDTLPAVAALGLTVVHCTISELVWGRTLGKWLVGGRVVTVGGARPSAWAVLARNALKALVLFIPILVVVAVLNPHLQGLGDSAARTLVVADGGESAKDR